MFSITKFLFDKPRFLFLCSLFSTIIYLTPSTLACSSRSLPKPRPSSIAAPTSTRIPITSTTTQRVTTTSTTTTTTTTTTTPRPNITFPTFKCPANYDAWYCLNESTCFMVKISESIMYNCECALGFTGQRCEFKELDGSYEPKRPRPILEKASIASGATCILLFLLFVCLTLYLRYDQKSAKLMDTDDYFGSYIITTSSSSNSNKTYNNCRFCSDKYCCSSSDFNDSKFLLANDKIHSKSVGGGGSWLRQHIEAFPMGLTIKRFNKM